MVTCTCIVRVDGTSDTLLTVECTTAVRGGRGVRGACRLLLHALETTVRGK